MGSEPGVQAAGGGGGGSGRLKRALLRNLILGLRKAGVASREMGFHERKSAIKRAADAALASARGDAPCWSRSLAAELARHRSSAIRPAPSAEPCKALATPPRPSRKMVCKKILRRSLLRRPKPGNTTAANRAYGAGVVLARAMVRKRTNVLKEIVPGGKALDVCTLLGETLDYAVSLKAQVDVMQLLVRTLQEQKKLK
ncbi:transcription factor IBH1-like 1 [Oryza brachyantha]|uniref:transcription factor IBH1-like 1 n=1 Tax=Oryza brachyantha TaxID=4533 RepID=UPI001ADC39CD|nr:transcription factor IBH1-like 1 [Oryza brachyantha]